MQNWHDLTKFEYLQGLIGVAFMTLEDETGHVNVVVWKDLGERQRKPLGNSAIAPALLYLLGPSSRAPALLYLLGRVFTGKEPGRG